MPTKNETRDWRYKCKVAWQENARLERRIADLEREVAERDERIFDLQQHNEGLKQASAAAKRLSSLGVAVRQQGRPNAGGVTTEQFLAIHDLGLKGHRNIEIVRDLRISKTTVSLFLKGRYGSEAAAEAYRRLGWQLDASGKTFAPL